MKIIGNYEARTHWSEMLQDVKAGARYVILHKGAPIAELVPPQAETRQMRSQRAARRLLDLMSTREQTSADIAALIGEGRD